MVKRSRSSRVEYLAQRRTELAHERTILSYIRTFAASVLFGVALISLSDNYGVLLAYAGFAAILIGFGWAIAASKSYAKHRKKWKEMGLE